MNQEKIGAFIAECRKKKSITQGQLADLVGLSDKAVSKWERGLSLPDTSLFPKLCEVLEISLEELFQGEAIQKKQEGPTILEEHRNKKSNLKTIIVTLTIIILFAGVFLLSVFYVNNYDSFKIYTISERNEKFEVSGLLSLIEGKSMFILNPIIYLGDDMEIADIEYTILNKDDFMVHRVGNISDFESHKKEFTVKMLREELSKMSLILNESPGLEEIFDSKIKNRKLKLELRILTVDFEELSEYVELEFKQEFANNKLNY